MALTAREIIEAIDQSGDGGVSLWDDDTKFVIVDGTVDFERVAQILNDKLAAGGTSEQEQNKKVHNPVHNQP